MFGNAKSARQSTRRQTVSGPCVESLEGRQLLSAGGTGHDVRHAVVTLTPAPGMDISGRITFHETERGVMVHAMVRGLTPGDHGFHIHEGTTCDPNSTPPFASAGGHFNPTLDPHGAPGPMPHHDGDMGNLHADRKGKANLVMVLDDPRFTMSGPTSILNHAVIIHANPDDLHTQPTGSSGGRVACGIIEPRVNGNSGEDHGAAATAPPSAGGSHHERDGATADVRS